jgi:hypothetical protein
MTLSLKKIAPCYSPDFGRKRIESLSTASWFKNKRDFSYNSAIAEASVQARIARPITIQGMVCCWPRAADWCDAASRQLFLEYFEKQHN